MYDIFFSKGIEFLILTDRSLCIQMIKEHGELFFSGYMDQIQKMSMPRQKKK